MAASILRIAHSRSRARALRALVACGAPVALLSCGARSDVSGYTSHGAAHADGGHAATAPDAGSMAHADATAVRDAARDALREALGDAATDAGTAHDGDADASATDAPRDAFADALPDAPRDGFAEAAPDAPRPVVTAIAAGSAYTCALLSDGHVACWGLNDSGQLGDGTKTSSSVPVRVVGLSDVTAIAADPGGGTTCALVAGGLVQCWGQLNPSPVSTPVSVTGWAGPVVAFAMDAPRCAILADGSVQCLLAAPSGGLTPVTDVELSNVTALAAVGDGLCAVQSNGGVLCTLWPMPPAGSADWGDAGPSARPIAGISGASAIASGAASTRACVIVAGGSVECWTETSVAWTPSSLNTWSAAASVPGLSPAVALAVGWPSACAVLVGGSVVCGQIDKTGLAGPFDPVGVSDATAITMGSNHACALRANGSVACWGCDDLGQLGDGATLAPTTGCLGEPQTSGPAVPVTVTW